MGEYRKWYAANTDVKQLFLYTSSYEILVW